MRAPLVSTSVCGVTPPNTSPTHGYASPGEITHERHDSTDYARNMRRADGSTERERRVLALRRRFALKDYLTFLGAATTVLLDSRTAAYQAEFHDREFADASAVSLLIESGKTPDPGYVATSPLRAVPAATVPKKDPDRVGL